MNARQAKRLRREACNAPVANQPTSYVITHKTIELDTACTRHLYQQFKKERKMGLMYEQL